MSISVSAMLQIHYSTMMYFADMRSQQCFGKSYLCTYKFCKAMYLTTNYYIHVPCRRMVIYYLFFFHLMVKFIYPVAGKRAKTKVRSRSLQRNNYNVSEASVYKPIGLSKFLPSLLIWILLLRLWGLGTRFTRGETLRLTQYTYDWGHSLWHWQYRLPAVHSIFI